MRTLFLLVVALLSLSVYPPESVLTSRTGQDYALFFAINQYDHLDNLQNPIKNATDIALELEQSYGFSTEVVKNATIDEVDQKIEEYQRKFSNGTFSSTGQLFIYFTGHGIQTANNGYFMAKDSDPERPQRTGIEYDYYREQIDQINCRHILVAIDACHSATFDPSYSFRNDGRRFSRKGEEEFDRIIANHDNYQARCFWTSDGQGEQTPDKSNFAYYLLEGLRTHQGNTDYLRSSELFATYVEKAAPKPGGGRFGKDEPSACFLFFKPKRVVPIDARADRTAYQQAQQLNTMAAYRQYIRDYPAGDFKRIAEQKLSALEAEKAEFSAWENTKALNNREAYENFIRAYPESLYTEVAESNKNNLPENITTTTPFISTIHDGMVFVQGGTYQMGSNDGNDNEKPVHRVTVADFYIGRYEVTQKQWREVMGSDPEELYNKNCDNCPVEGVSWDDIQTFLTNLNQQTDRKYRLPSEAEWEYAARGGKQSKDFEYAGSDNLKEVAWFSDTFGTIKTSRVVGTKHPNELNLYDMSGNVWEWCEDGWHYSYINAPKDGGAWKGSARGSYRVYRGGSYCNIAKYCRVAGRICWHPFSKDINIGFRLAHSL